MSLTKYNFLLFAFYDRFLKFQDTGIIFDRFYRVAIN